MNSLVFMIVCPPKIILSDFNVYHTLWVSLRVDGRGEKIVVNDSDLILLNDGSPTVVKIIPVFRASSTYLWPFQQRQQSACGTLTIRWEPITFLFELNIHATQ